MKTVILCGGLGTRISEETHLKPKPMVEIGTRPILWHLMNYYSTLGFKDFCLALGYKSEIIKDYFVNYYERNSDLEINLKTKECNYIRSCNFDWKVSLIDTGLNSMTGGRLFKLRDHLKDEKTFMLTYGDGLSNVDLNYLLNFHYSHQKIATVTAVRPPARFGAMQFDNNKVVSFNEKPQAGEGWINGGFFVFNREIFKYLEDESTILEKEPFENLAADGELMAYKHEGFWQCMDTIRDKVLLEKMWNSDNAPWSVSTSV